MSLFPSALGALGDFAVQSAVRSPVLPRGRILHNGLFNPSEVVETGVARGVTLDPEQRATYLGIVSTMSSVIGARAKAAFEMCAAYSVRFQYADRFSQSCQAWLAWYEPKHRVALDELMAAPTMSSSALMPIRAILEPAMR